MHPGCVQGSLALLWIPMGASCRFVFLRVDVLVEVAAWILWMAAVLGGES